MKIQFFHGLPIVSVNLRHQNQPIEINHVLLNTGSVGTIFSMDQVEQIGLLPNKADPIHRVVGIGGDEYVFSKTIDSLTLSREMQVSDFQIEVGDMNYEFQLNGILGMDFLKHVGVCIDLVYDTIEKK